MPEEKLVADLTEDQPEKKKDFRLKADLFKCNRCEKKTATRADMGSTLQFNCTACGAGWVDAKKPEKKK